MAKPTTKFYTGRVRLGGSLLNEAHVVGVPAAEIIMLEAIHGAGAVVGLREALPSEIKAPDTVVLDEVGAPHNEGWSDRVIRGHMRRKYLSWQDEGQDKVARVFGPSLNPLPKEVDTDHFGTEARAQKVDPDLLASLEKDIRAKIEREQAEQAAVADAARATAKHKEAFG